MRARKKRTSKGRTTGRCWHFTTAAGYFLAVILIASISLWIRAAFLAPAGYAPHDDLLFVRLAHYLSLGEWLGPFDQYTLAKGMFYPMFIAVVHFAGVPLKIAEHITYLAASGLAAELVRRRTRSAYLALGLFTLLAFNPGLWAQDLSRVLREGLYVSLSLLLVVSFVAVVFPSQWKGRFAVLYRVAGGVGLGLIGAAYWLTREEAIWLLPSLGTITLLGAASILWPGTTLGPDESIAYRSRQIRAVALPLLLTGLTFTAADFLVAGLNYRYYGIFETNEFRSKGFLRAFGALTRIRRDHWQSDVIVPKDARERAYAVSSAARELRPSFEGPYSAGWRQTVCSGCAEVPSGWFMWMFRGAVENAGHYRTGSDAMKFYNTLADQIDAGCAQGRIDCLQERDTLTPPFRREYLGPSIKAGQALAKIMVTLRDGGPLGSTIASTGSDELISLFSQMIGEVSPSENALVRNRVFVGWAGTAYGAPSVQLLERGTEQYQSSTTTLPAQDIVAQYPSLKAVRFQVETDCPLESCALVVQVPGEQPYGFPLMLLSPGSAFGSPSTLMLNIDSVSASDPTLPESMIQSPQLRVASIVTSGYAIGFPILVALGALGLLLAIVLKRLRAIPMEVLALGLASLAAVGTRIALLAYITATSFPAVNMKYSSAASPFVIMFAVIGIYCGYSAFSGKYRRPPAEQAGEPVHAVALSPQAEMKDGRRWSRARARKEIRPS